MSTIKLSVCGMLAAAAFLTGCASSGVKNPSGVQVTEMKADERGFVAGTGIESQDLVAVTDKMSRSILSIPQITNARGTPRIVLDPVHNETRFPINKDIFLTRIRTQLNSKSMGRVLFLARDRMAMLDKGKMLMVDTRQAFDKAGTEPLTGSPGDLAALIRSGIPKYASIVKAVGLKPE